MGEDNFNLCVLYNRDFTLYTLICFVHWILHTVFIVLLLYYCTEPFIVLMNTISQVESWNVTSSCARDHIMWMLMQCTFGSGKPISAYEYIAFTRLYDQLYSSDAEPLSVADVTNPHCVISSAATCIWIHMQRKKEQLAEQKAKARPIPNVLRQQLE